MQRRRFLQISLLAPLATQLDLAYALPAPREVVADGKPHRFGFRQREFVLDGAPQQLLSSERQRFLTEDWPQVRERIERLGLDPAELIDPSKKWGAP